MVLKEVVSQYCWERNDYFSSNSFTARKGKYFGQQFQFCSPPQNKYANFFNDGILQIA